MTDRTQAAGLQVATSLYRFIADEALPAAGISLTGPAFWAGVAEIVADLTPVNRGLLRRRDELQAAIDAWHRANAGQPHDAAKYRAFLEEIGYLVPDPGPFQVGTEGVDPEIASLPGPQLVVPVTNARFAINAANARWGSLYDAFYGTDAIPETDGATREGAYNPVRGQRVIDTVRDFLDEAVPLDGASHRDVTAYSVTAGGLTATTAAGPPALADPAAFAGYAGDPGAPSRVLLRHHGLHLELVIDRAGPIGAHRPGRGPGRARRGRRHHDRRLRGLGCRGRRRGQGRRVPQLARPEHRRAERAGGEGRDGPSPGALSRTAPTPTRRAQPFTLPGRALLLVRNVGHLMTTDAVLDAEGAEVFEGILDAIVTALAALPGLRADAPRRNSRAGSVYIVKPKQHGPDEVRLHRHAVRPGRGAARARARTRSRSA